MNNISWPVVKHHFRQEPSRSGRAAHPAGAEPRFGARALKAGVSFPARNYRAGNKVSENGVSFWGQVWTSRGPGIQRGMPSGLVGAAAAQGSAWCPAARAFTQLSQSNPVA